MAIRFSSVRGSYKFLSNYYPCTLIIDNKDYYHTEGFYQSQKFVGINEEAVEHIRKLKKPGDAKKIARSYRLTEHQTNEWNNNRKLTVMKKALLFKFLGNLDIQNSLLDTRDIELIEYAPWDEYWGSGKYGNGQNMLGKLLMQIRDDIVNNTIDFALMYNF